MWDNVIGSLDWDACDKCKHYPPKTGGCDVEGWNNIETEHDFVYCLSFEDISVEDVEEINPDQLELLQ